MISVVIPSYNGEELLSKNLQAVKIAWENPVNRIGEVIVVDDGSRDKSIELVKREYPKIKTVRHKKNRGVSASMNTGARTAKGTLIALVNNDVVPSKNFLKSVLDKFEDPDVFAVSLSEKGYSWATVKFSGGFIVHQPGRDRTKVHKSFWASGGSAVFRRDYWMRLGGMDEKIFSPYYWEDLDLSYRAQKRGLKILWDPKAKVIHNHESTVSKLSKKKVTKIRERNELLFIWKNITSNNLFRKHISGLVRRIFRNPGYAIIVFVAFLRIRLVLRARKKERKESKVSDEAIFASFS